MAKCVIKSGSRIDVDKTVLMRSNLGDAVLKSETANARVEGKQVLLLTNSGYQFVLQEDGNMVLYNPSMSAIWQTNTANR